MMALAATTERPEVVTGTFSVKHGSEGEVAHMIGAFQAHNSHADTPSTDN